MDIERRRLLASVGASASLLLAGCAEECGPGDDTFADVEERISDGEVSGNKTYVRVHFEGVIEQVELKRLVLDDGTAKADILPPKGRVFETEKYSEGDCYLGDGIARISDNVDSDRLVVRE